MPKKINPAGLPVKKNKKLVPPLPRSELDAIANALPRPSITADRDEKKNYAQRLSNEVARFVAHRLRGFGATNAVPDETGGAERRFAGGIGDKKVDVSLGTVEHGLILSIGIKSINFPDAKTKNYQKNLTNRRGDMLAEATTLHQRFPYAVIGGLFLFEEGAEKDGTPQRLSTFRTAHQMFKSFGNRPSRSDAVENYEVLGVVLYNGNAPYSFRYFDAGTPDVEQPLDSFFFRLLEIVAQRNPDTYRFFQNRLVRAGGGTSNDTGPSLFDVIDKLEDEADSDSDENLNGGYGVIPAPES